jgi:hypothetical protein
MAYTTIDDPTIYFNTVTYSGDGNSTQAITGVGHQPDWVWIKSRSNTENHMLSDAVRGSTKRLRSDTTNAEDDLGSNGIQSFNADGFTAGDGDAMNASGQTYVAWNWLAGGSASSNSDGSITSSVSANTTAGFSIVSYTGTGANATVGHGLGTNMDFAIFKLRSGSSAWLVYHKSLGATKAIYLNETGAVGTNSSGFNDTEPTSSVFSLGNGATANTSGGTQIAYCFAEKKGFSKFGSYTGNGNADGTFIYTGFRPALVIGKKSSASGNSWWIMDNKRPGYNVIGNYLSPNTSSAESTGSSNLDFTSTGFKIRRTGGFINDSSATYIYTAFAEAPFVTAGTKAAGTAR